MKVLQVTNIVCHLQLPVARELAAALGTKHFRFAAVTPPDPERLRLGWAQDESAEWLLRTAERREDNAELMKWWDQADVVFCGQRCLDLFRARLNAGKLTFYMSERWWKPPIGVARLLHPQFLRMALRFRRLAGSPLFHFLGCGANATRDIRYLAAFPSRAWRWGYFTPEPDKEPPAQRAGHGLNILWAGRMLRWKRVDTLLRAFALVAQQLESIHLRLIGHGPMEPRLRALAEELEPSRESDLSSELCAGGSSAVDAGL